MPDLSWEHAAEARAALNAIVTDPGHGVAALSSAQTMSNLLKDLLPDAPREKSILVAAAEAGLAESLREHVAQGMDPSTAIRLAASSFSTATPFTPEACAWVASEMAIALGISQGVADSGGTGPPGGAQPGSGQIDQQGMPTQVAQIPGYGSAPGQAAAPAPAPAPQSPGQGYPTQAAPQAFPQSPRTPQSPGQAYPTQVAPQAYPQAPGQPFQAQVPPQAYPQVPGQGPGAGFAPGGPGAGQQAPGGWQPAAGGYGPGGAYSPGAPPGGYGPGVPPGGYGPVVGFGPGGRPPGKSGTKRGLLVAGLLVVALIVVIVIAATLSSGGKPSAHGSNSPSQGSTSPTTPTTSPTTPSTVPEALSAIMNPAGLPAVGTGCSQASLNGLNGATITARLFCQHTSVNSTPTNLIVVWAYQFDSYSDYLAGFSKVNSITGFRSSGAAHHCPPARGSRFASTTWFAISNAKYGKSQEHGQYLECFIELTKANKRQPLLVWTMPSQNVVFISRNEAPLGTFAELINWWKHVSYG